MRTMLVCIDFSDVTQAVIKTAGDYAKAGGFHVHLLHVLPEEAELVGYDGGMQFVPISPVTPTPHDTHMMDACREELEVLGIEVTSNVVEGAPQLEIADEAEKLGAELIVMGSHRHGVLYHLFLGSTSESVLRRVPCPLLIVPAPVGGDAVGQDSASASVGA